MLLGRRQIFKALLAAMTASAIGGSPVFAAPPLDDLAQGLAIKKDQISVSGISSGAFMAHQFHVAHSANIMGAGIVAGGPYYCAKGSMLDAVTKCSSFMALTCNQMVKYTPYNKSVCKAGYLGPENDAQAIRMAQASFDKVKTLSGEQIDRLENIAKAKIFLFRGTADRIVPSGVMEAVYHFYRDGDKGSLSAQSLEFDNTFAARHAMVTDNFYREGTNIVGRCNADRPPEGDSYITDCAKQASEVKAKNNCACTPEACQASTPQKVKACNDANKIDLSGAILEHIYGSLNERERLAPQGVEGAGLDAELGKLVQPFDQKAIFAIFASWPENTLLSSSMAREGYVYIPEGCKNGAECRLHVAFHGCKQGGKTGDNVGGGYSGNLYAKYSGYNEWARTNNIVVLYPQVQAWNSGPVNPQGCWDWWGQFYTHENYATKHGLQIKAVAQMINVLVNDKHFLDIPIN